MNQTKPLRVCGDCGDELIPNPAADPPHTSTNPHTGAWEDAWYAGETGPDMHADGSRPCYGRADAIMHKPELLDRFYPGGLSGDLGANLRSLMEGRPDLTALVESRTQVQK